MPDPARIEDPLATARTFREEWARLHPKRQPAGWLLRQDRDLPWIRFHALPGSKRYAETAAERRTILARGNWLGDRILRPHAPCWLVAVSGEEEVQEDPAGPTGAPIGLCKEVWGNKTLYEDIWYFRARPTVWVAGTADAILTAIAEYKTKRLWIDRKSGAVFAPYDGGFDLFPATCDDVAVLRADRPDWLSEHPSGL